MFTMPTRRSSTRSDAELTAVLHAATETAGSEARSASDAALDELFRRHRPSVLAYARTCCRDPHTAEDLTSEAFTRTLGAVRSGGGPTEAWRPYLLTAVRRTAAAWSDTARRTELVPDIERRLDDAPAAESSEERMLRVEDGQLVLRAFRSLPERWQAVLWHSAVEEEPAPQVAGLLGISAGGIASLASRAREGLREAYLTVHAERADSSDECRRYSALLAASVRRTGRRSTKDLDRHLEDCADCRRALVEVTELNSTLRTVLPAAVLLWGGSAYLTKAAAATTATATGAGTAAGSAAGAGVSAKAAGGVAAAVAALAVGGYLLFPDDGGNKAAPGPAPSPTRAAAPASSAPADDPSRAASEPSKPPSPSATLPDRSPQADHRTRLRIMSTGRCMDIAAHEGAEPREAACDGGASQRWELLVDRPAQQTRIRNRATGMCLTHTGSDAGGAPVRQRPCTTGDLMRWTYHQQPDNLVLAQQGTSLFLGLNDWDEAASGRPHSPTIGTTPNYYNTESLRFRSDLTGNM